MATILSWPQCVKVMACCLFPTKSLHDLHAGFLLLDPQEVTQIVFREDCFENAVCSGPIMQTTHTYWNTLY